MAKKESSQQASEQQEGKVDRIDNALQKFSDMLIARMEQMKESKWKKGWTDGRTAQFGLPQNLVGRPYTGSNAFLCQIHTTMEHYRMPVYLTIKQIRDAGAMIKKGEHSIPIFKWDLRIKDKDGKKLSESDYRNMTKEEQAECTVRPYLKVYNEWNIDQTNLEEVNKEKYDTILKRFKSEPIKDEVGMYKNEAFDNLLKEQSWVCPIEYEKFNESAFYSPKRDQIVVPSKKQFNISNTPEDVFKDGMEFYGTTIHEMAHSTGHESRLGRDGIVKIDQFGSDQYAKEELVAELTSALIGNAMGFDSRIRENNIAYLQNWIGSLKKDPKFLKSVMSDVNKSSKMVLEHIDEQRRKLGEKALLDGNLDGEEEREKNEKEMQEIVNDATQEKESFSAFLESRTFQVLKGIIISAEWNTGNPLHNVSNFQDFKKAFASVTDIDKFEPSYPKADEKDLTLLKTQVAAMSQKELLEAGAYMLPYYHYPHKEGRTLEDIRQSFRRIEKIGKANPGNEQIQKRVEQARSIYNRYEQNVMDQYKSYEISEDEMKIPSISMPRYTYIEGLPQLEARQQIQKEFNSLESYMKAISLKSGDVSVRYNIDNNMLEAWREVDGNSELFTSRKYDRRMDGRSNMDDFVFHLANEDAKAANMPLYSENKENKMMLEYIEKRAFVWSRLNNQLKHPSGEILNFDYVKEKDAIDAFVMSEKGKRKVYSMYYGQGGDTILENYNFVKKELLSMKQFQKKEDPREAVAKEWDSLAEKPTVKMESGDVLPVEYNKEKDTLEVAYKTSEGEEKVHCTNYDHSQGINQNLGYVWEELSNMKQFQEKETKTEILSQGKDYFTSLMETITSTPNSEHTVLSVKTLPELRDYYKGNPNVGAWINQASNKEIIEAGADLLPNLRYSHKEGRSLYNIEAAYSNINALYPDVVDNDAKRQIVHRIKQAEEVVTSYHNNIEEKFGKEFLMEKENMNKVLSRNDYQEQGQTIQLDPKDEKKYFSSYNYFQMESETAEFDKLKDAEDYEGILALAKEYDQGDSMDLEHVETNMTPDYGDDVLIDDENYAVVYNNSVGGTYNLLRKYSENDIREAIERYGMPKTPSYAVKFIDQQMGLEKGVKPLVEISSPEAKAVAKSFREDLTPQFTMPNGKVLDYHYDASDNKVIVGEKLNDGSFIETYAHDYDFALSKAENMSAIYKELSTEYQAKKASEEKKTPREDSNIQTDVVGKAKQIASTGVPMEEAEKKASSIVKEEVHKEHHKQEAEKDKQEKDKANQAAAEEKKEQQEKKEESKEASEATAKALTHAALLVGALSAAKQNEGIWMNKSQKGNAEFINTHTPITAYNNIMMNLNSDANKYKTNVYTYYNPAKENNMPVKQNEKGMEFHWTSWGYQNAMDKDEVITSKQFDKLPDDEKSFYTKHATRVVQNIYNVEQTTMNANNHDAYVELLKTKGSQLSQNEKEQKGKYSSIMKQWKELKGKHPDALLLFRIGDFYEMYKQDAKRGSEVLGITLTKMNGSKDFHLAGFPHQALDTYLPKLIRAGERVAICDQLESKKTVSQGFDAKAILNKAYATAKEVAKQSGMQYERVMVLQDAKYDSKEDKIVVSGMKGEVGNEKMAALYKANDIYRAVVAATGTENRLDRSGRNNLLPEDDAKHEQLVRELAAGVMMARQGLPAILSKENEKLIPYWEREIKENPKLLGIVERDVNNAVETIDNLVAKRKVDYEVIRGQLPGKTMENPSKYSISQDLAKLPNIETKEIVVVKDILRKEADVILPAGASLEVNNEVPGMRKDRITIALKKEGIDDVRFYNAGGSLGLNKPNSYFQGKEVTLNNLKQYELVPHHTLDVEKQAAPKKEVIIKNFQAIKDDNGRYAFFIKPENEPSFSVYPAKEHLNTFYNVIKTDKQAIVHNALAQRYYEMATKHPDTKLDLITPKKVDVDMKLIERPSITSSAQDAKQKLIFATINGQRVQAPINKQQWQKMWLAEDMGAYKRALAAVIFEPMLKRGMEEEQSQQAVSESEKVEIKEKPAPENKVQETVTETHRTGLHM